MNLRRQTMTTVNLLALEESTDPVVVPVTTVPVVAPVTMVPVAVSVQPSAPSREDADGYEILEDADNLFVEEGDQDPAVLDAEIADLEALLKKLVMGQETLERAVPRDDYGRLTDSQMIAFAAAGDDDDAEEEKELASPVKAASSVNLQINTASPRSPIRDIYEELPDFDFDAADRESKDENEEGHELPYHVDESLLNLFETDTSPAQPKVPKLRFEASIFTAFCLQHGIETPPAPTMPAEMVTSPHSVPVTPHHAQITRKHHESLKYYMSSGLVFTNHHTPRDLVELRQRTVPSTPTSVVSSGNVATSSDSPCEDPVWLVKHRLEEHLKQELPKGVARVVLRI